MNIYDPPVKEEAVAELFHLLAQYSRLQILAAIGKGEACVCHLEAVLGLRQAYISQQLMILRDGGLVTTHRDGRNIYYRLAQPEILDLVRCAASLLNANNWLDTFNSAGPVASCPCPHCAAAAGVEASQVKKICCDKETLEHQTPGGPD